MEKGRTMTMDSRLMEQLLLELFMYIRDYCDNGDYEIFDEMNITAADFDDLKEMKLTPFREIGFLNTSICGIQVKFEDGSEFDLHIERRK
jgi:hypothetical protein